MGTWSVCDETEETTKCIVCGNPTPALKAQFCHNCWEVERRLDSYLRSKKGRTRMRKRLCRRLRVWVERVEDGIALNTWYFSITLYSPHFWMWDWAWEHPKARNWFRLLVNCPIGDFHISGWLFWGKRPQKDGV